MTKFHAQVDRSAPIAAAANAQVADTPGAAGRDARADRAHGSATDEQ